MNMFDDKLADIIKKEKEASNRLENCRALYRNLSRVYLLCQRHPANVPALIEELNYKLEQDIYLIKEIRNRLWEQRFERQTQASNFREMKSLIQSWFGKKREKHYAVESYNIGMEDVQLVVHSMQSKIRKGVMTDFHKILLNL